MPSLPPPLPFTCRVQLPLGRVVVTVDRRGLTLGERGGFAARWDDAGTGNEPTLAPEAFRRRVREHLRAVVQHEERRAPPKIALNLAAHQLLEDLTGWCRLNAG